MLIDSSYEDIKELVKDKKFPIAICDLDALYKNLERVGEHLRRIKKKLRLCTKSVRVPELIKKVEDKDFVNGLFTYNSAEALFFAKKYQIKDILMGYPTMSKVDARELCEAASIENVQITVMTDSTEHLDLLEKEAAKNDVKLSVMVELDVADHFLGRTVGCLRSPLRKPQEVVNIAKEAEKRPHLNFRGIMGYEAQNASLGDDKFLYRFVKKRSRQKVNEWRQKVVDALTSEGLKPEVVNGGGSGCFEETGAEKSITEIGIGSLLFKSHIFDSINSLQDFIPSMFFVLQIVRMPKDNVATAFSGGYVSSGAIRAAPIPVIPKGLEISDDEGFGEVQTPFFFDPEEIKLTHGDPIFCRFGKAGEPLEHFNEVNIYSDGKIIDRFLTHRGFGNRFS
ncbi:MAG: hypothetical protein GF353_25860 [Candidatus Lokiarchaeota archaeon]|nr:hypothetical protein [Candidatus Lokiarchaeota archaeon]